ncbi:SDR family oxidoreductase [Hyphococcus lacteus]|uniref:Divinyl chlorophyllide a 8-vinyl-reductase, chloroplastic n=1 Tax=Hyphococcus lacteus TaxID=3143536 RepID=A0ABV3Z1A9_9PROT
MQKTVLIAGATGYLGSFLTEAYKRAGYRVKALSRQADQIRENDLWVDEIYVGEATKVESLRGICDGVDLVVSALGITRQQDGMSYEQVDYGANLNLMNEALRSEVKQFVYVHVLNADRMPNVELAIAKQKFVDALAAAPIRSCVICPSGYFSDLRTFLEMAQKGKIYLFGQGEFAISPIHGSDLAATIVESAERGVAKLDVGGPHALSQNQIAKMAFAALGKSERITHVPLWLGKAIVFLAKNLGFRSQTGPLEFFLAASSICMSAPAHGEKTLKQYFENEARRFGRD